VSNDNKIEASYPSTIRENRRRGIVGHLGGLGGILGLAGNGVGCDLLDYVD
jgi:hypothetical protein